MTKKEKSKKSIKLSLVESDNENNTNNGSDPLVAETILKINEKYAKEYESKKRREELAALEEKYSSNASYQKSGNRKKIESNNDSNNEDEEDYSDTDNEEDVTEDEFGDVITPELDVQILKTISSLRNKTSDIYDPKKQFFDDSLTEHNDKRTKFKKDSKSMAPLSLKEYHNKMLLEGYISNSDSDTNENYLLEQNPKNINFQNSHNNKNAEKPLSFMEEQELLKTDLKNAIQFFSKNEENDDDNDLLIIKKDKYLPSDLTGQTDEYKAFLMEQLNKDPSLQNNMNEWLGKSKSINRSEYKSKPTYEEEKPSLDPDESFLANFILNRGWIDKDKKKELQNHQFDVSDSEDEEQLERAEDFENTYNFRFEQDGASQLISHSRHIEGSVRKEDLTRKKKRKEKITKKLEKVQKEAEELKRLKNLKKAEILEKKKTIERISGTHLSEFDLNDLDEDFDPEKHDLKMKKLFDDEYYSHKEKIDDDEKFLEMDEELKNILGEDSENESIGEFSNPENLKRKMINENTLEKKSNTSVKKLEDEYLKLHYEDKIGDVRTRFRYSSVVPSSFGLDVNDILKADDKLLNWYVSLKKLAPYKNEVDQKIDIEKYGKRKRLRKFYHQMKGFNKDNEKKEDLKIIEMATIKDDSS